MRDRIYYLITEYERGHTDERLRRCAADFLGLEVNDSRLEVCRTGEGKPYFPLLALHCSVSHSGGVWLCAISEKPVGADVQIRQKCPTQDIARRFFHPDEVKWLEENPDGFFELWSAKESYVKYTGAGLAGGFDSFSVIKNDHMQDKIAGLPVVKIPFLPEYSLYVCGGDGGEVELVCFEET